MKLDTAQRAIINAAIERHSLSHEQRTPDSSVINVQAIAGAGKSVVITELTRCLSNASFLFLCFSASIADRARATLPASVTVATFDQAARSYVQQTHAMKISPTIKLPRGLSDKAIHQATELQATSQEIRVIRRVLHLFYQSAHARIDPPLVDQALASLKIDKPGIAEHLLQLSRMVWSSQSRRSETSAPLCQGSMIKLWTLGRKEYLHEKSAPSQKHQQARVISPLGNADVIAVEEAQDLTEAMIGFLGRQNRVVMLFGDAMQTLQGTTPIPEGHALQVRGYRATLMQSYRYGQDVASLLSTLQARALSTELPVMAGRPGMATDICMYEGDVLASGIGRAAHVTLIGVSLLDVLPLVIDYPEIKVGWVDGLMSPGYHFQTLWDIACLSASQGHPVRKRIRNRWIREAGTLERLHQQLTQRQAWLSIGLCEWVMANAHTPLIPALEALHQREIAYQHAMVHDVRSVTTPDLTFATPITAKGHEWPTVAISPSMTKSLAYMPEAGPLTGGHLRSLCRLYTGISRVQHTLLIPEEVLEFSQQQGVEISARAATSLPLAPPQDHEHPYFGLARHRVLEMSTDSRKARRDRYQRQQERGRQRQHIKGRSPQPRNNELGRSQIDEMKKLLRNSVKPTSD